MVVVYLTNGFGNNIFQYVAGRLLSTFHNQELVVIPPSDDYYANSDLELLNIGLSNSINFGNCVDVNDHNYFVFFDKKYEDKNFKLKGYLNKYYLK